MTKLSVSITDEETARKLEAMAEAEGRSVAGVVKRLVKEAPPPKGGKQIQTRAP